MEKSNIMECKNKLKIIFNYFIQKEREQIELEKRNLKSCNRELKLLDKKTKEILKENKCTY